MLIVFQRLEAQERELKSILTVSSFGMASASVATRLGQDRNHIVY
jgi:hypothetical protein